MTLEFKREGWLGDINVYSVLNISFPLSSLRFFLFSWEFQIFIEVEKIVE